eukprot:768086-Hanusia_phi.AAC.3
MSNEGWEGIWGLYGVRSKARQKAGWKKTKAHERSKGNARVRIGGAWRAQGELEVWKAKDREAGEMGLLQDAKRWVSAWRKARSALVSNRTRALRSRSSSRDNSLIGRETLELRVDRKHEVGRVVVWFCGIDQGHEIFNSFVTAWIFNSVSPQLSNSRRVTSCIPATLGLGYSGKQSC